jgi:hypothetical protein
MNGDQPSWYYAESGKRIGPFEMREIEKLVGEGKIQSETLVWMGEGDWQPAKLSSLSRLFNTINQAIPPPLTGKYVDNRFAWAIVAVPIIGASLEFFIGHNLIWIYLSLNIVLCIIDAQRLRLAGHQAPTQWMVFLIPVYLWKRASMLKQKQIYVIAWTIAFALSIYLPSWGQRAIAEESAIPIVTQIIQQKLGGSATCKAVSVTEDLGNGFYKARAILDNGNDLIITIEKINDSFYVKMSPY